MRISRYVINKVTFTGELSETQKPKKLIGQNSFCDTVAETAFMPAANTKTEKVWPLLTFGGESFSDFPFPAGG